ncbi:MAG: hypothetical protein Q7K03_04905 [Dehalococcoidia bacterium]|nr:hypothetical protein [Dehalococcoidia bacterium]
MRIGINVPDDLLKRFEPIKQVTNVSQVCRDAIKTWVDSYEAATERASKEGMETLAARLAQQVTAQAVDWEALGYEDAKMWCQLASLKEFQNAFHNHELLKREGRNLGLWAFEFQTTAKSFRHKYTDYKEWFEHQYEFYDVEEARDRIDQAEQEYTRSYLTYVTSVWQMVKDRVAADAMIREKALAETRARVVLPQHLVNPKSIA